MSKYAVLFWNTKHTKLLQVFGPYDSEWAAENGIKRMKEWPAFTEGEFETVKLYGDPELPAATYPAIPYAVPIPYYPPVYPYHTTVTWTADRPIAITSGSKYTYQLS